MKVCAAITATPRRYTVHTNLAHDSQQEFQTVSPHPLSSPTSTRFLDRAPSPPPPPGPPALHHAHCVIRPRGHQRTYEFAAPGGVPLPSLAPERCRRSIQDHTPDDVAFPNLPTPPIETRLAGLLRRLAPNHHTRPRPSRAYPARARPIVPRVTRISNNLAPVTPPPSLQQILPVRAGYISRALFNRFTTPWVSRHHVTQHGQRVIRYKELAGIPRRARHQWTARLAERGEYVLKIRPARARSRTPRGNAIDIEQLIEQCGQKTL